MIVITGASDGLGKELAKLYKAEGKRVTNLSRNSSDVADINIKLDLTDTNSVENAANKLLEIEEPIEVLVNAAGVLSIEKLNNISNDSVQKLLSTNVGSAIILVSRLTDRLIKDASDIVNVSSTVGTKGYEDQAVYGASKWAMRGFTANLQAEFKGKPNRIISFMPGGFKSRLFEKATGIDNTDEGRWMSAQDVAKALKQTLDLPKNMEVSEIIINRK